MRAVAKIFIQNGDAYQTVNYRPSVYLGDPMNIARIYSDQGCQEIIFIIKGQIADSMLQSILSVTTVPCALGGLAPDVNRARELVSFGSEKIILSDRFVENPKIASAYADTLGAQAVSVSLDYRRIKGRRMLVTGDMRRDIVMPLEEFVRKTDFADVGEVLFSNVDADGARHGLDFGISSEIEDVTIKCPILLNCGYRFADDHCLEEKAALFDGFLASREFALFGNAPLTNYPTRYEVL